MRVFYSLIWVVALLSVFGIIVACGSDGGDSESSGGAASYSGRVPPPTPTVPPADKQATAAAAPKYGGGYGGGGLDTPSITTIEAKDNIGKMTKVCGVVAATIYEPEHSYRVTFLNFDKAEDPDFFVYFWHSGKRIGDWPDIADPSIDLSGGWFDGQSICATGLIQRYRNTAGINAGFWHQIEIQE